MSSNRNLSKHIVWSEKYRPTTVADCILPEQTAKIAAGFVTSGKIPHLLLHGSAGTGKTTLAKALCDDLNYEYKVINGSNEGRLIDTLRTTVADFASKISFEGKRKCVIIDEADYIPDLVQAALRNFIDEFSKNCSFILTCNFPNKIMSPIHSRCVGVEFSIPEAERGALLKQVFVRVADILDTEGVTFEKPAVAAILKATFPDTRKLLNQLQKYAAYGTIDAGIIANNTSDVAEIVGYLKDKKWTQMRSWVAKQGSLDFEDFCRKLFSELEKVAKPDSLPQVVLTTADYQYRHFFVGDKEINAAAYLTQIMIDVEFK